MVAQPAMRPYITIFAVLSTSLSVAVLGCAGHILQSYNSQKNGNPWWLPLWPQHFDDRGLKTVIGGSTSVVVLNAACLASLFKEHKWRKAVILLTAFLAAVAAGVTVIYPAVLNRQSPMRATMQSWTCAYSSTTDSISAGMPANFPWLCMQNRLAFYAAVPVLILQCTVLALVMITLKKSNDTKDAAIGSTHCHELPSYRSNKHPSSSKEGLCYISIESR